MNQVQLKIEEFFDNVIAYDFAFNKECPDNLAEVFRIIDSRSEWTHGDSGLEVCKLEKNESLATIIKALWEYQKSLLPHGWYLQKLDIKKICESWDKNHWRIREFYDPETRIITITEFDKIV